jgi:diguanylate cyclase (GGDEF)-like protein
MVSVHGQAGRNRASRWHRAIQWARSGSRTSTSHVTRQSARIGMLVFASAAAIGFMVAIVSGPFGRPQLTMAGAVLAGLAAAVAIPALRRPRLVFLAILVVLYYAAVALVLLGESGESEGLLALTAIPLIASALYGPPSLTVTALIAGTATLVVDGAINGLSLADYAQLLTVWPITGVGIAYAIHQLRHQLEETVAHREMVIQHDAALALIADELYTAYDGDQVLHLGLQSAVRLTALTGAPEPRAVFFLADDDHATLIASYPDASENGDTDPLIDHVSVALSTTTTMMQEAVASHDDRLFVIDRSTPVPPEVEAILAVLKIENALVQLIRVGDADTGMLVLFNTGVSDAGFTIAQREWLQGLAPLLELALSRAFEIEAQTATDPLTGIANRREVDRRLSRMPRSVVYSLLAIDIDKLKTMNDTFGHQAGDELLRAVAQSLQGAVRRSDVAARTGGDEFCVILSDADSARSETVANRIFADLGTREVHGLHPRISIGIAPFGSGHDAAERLAAADAALYAAKRSGGNCVAHAPLLEAELLPTAGDVPRIVTVGSAPEPPAAGPAPVPTAPAAAA